MGKIVTFGEAMMRLAPLDFKRLEQTDQFAIEIGGSELNTAVGLSRLGRKVSWVSRFPDNQLGQMMHQRIRATGVDPQYIQFSPEGRLGLYFLELGAAPRSSQILYDRAHSTMSMIEPGMVPWQIILEDASWFHVTGITPAISPTAMLATREALEIAHQKKVTISCEVNYRSKLWSLENAKKWLLESLPLADVLITNPDEIKTFFGLSDDSLLKAAKTLTERFQLQAIAITQRETPSVWKNRFSAVGYSHGNYYESKMYEVEIVDRLGTGDAFGAGLIHGLLDQSLTKGIDYGVAMAALKHSTLGDIPWFNESEIEELIQSNNLRIKR